MAVEEQRVDFGDEGQNLWNLPQNVEKKSIFILVQ